MRVLTLFFLMVSLATWNYSSKVTAINDAEVQAMVLGSGPRCCIKAERPQCDKQSDYTTCYTMSGTTIPSQCNTPSETGDEKGWDFIACSQAYCSTGTGTQTCKTKNSSSKINMTGCRPKGTVSNTNPDCTSTNVHCVSESYDHSTVSTDSHYVDALFRTSTVTICDTSSTNVVCTAGQPQNICN